MIAVRIDVTKITKSRLFTGKKGTYLDIILIPTPNNEYGDFVAIEQVTKDERAAGKKGIILGNGKNLKPVVDQETLPPTDDIPKSNNNTTDDLPF